MLHMNVHSYLKSCHAIRDDERYNNFTLLNDIWYVEKKQITFERVTYSLIYRSVHLINIERYMIGYGSRI